MKEGEKAVKAYESFLKYKETPTDVDRLRMAYFYFMAKNYTKANEMFRLLAAKPEATYTTLKYFVYSLVESGDLAEAQKVAEKYFSIAPADKIEASDYNYQGQLLQKLTKDSLAIISYQKSLALNQDQADIQQAVADALYKGKRYPEAVVAYEKVIKLRKKPLSLDFYGLGRAAYYNSQFTKADTAFQKLAEMQPTRTIAFLWLGNTKANLDPDAKTDGAKLAFEKLIEIAAPAPDAGTNKKDLITSYMYLGFYYSQRDQLNEAKANMEKVLALDPNHERAKEILRLLKEGQKQQKQKPK